MPDVCDDLEFWGSQRVLCWELEMAFEETTFVERVRRPDDEYLKKKLFSSLCNVYATSPGFFAPKIDYN